MRSIAIPAPFCAWRPGARPRRRVSDCLGLFENLNGKDRAAILLDLLGRKVRVVVDQEFIDAA